MLSRVRKGFTLVEILIVVVILGILAAIVIPQFTSASEEAQVGNVQTQLQTMRSQIELFRVRNNGVSPTLDGEQPFEDFLRGVGNTLGLPDQNTVQEANGNDLTQTPYMRTAPVNPRNGLNTVAVVEDPITEAAINPVGADAGWYYNPQTGVIAAVGFIEIPGDENFGQWWEDND